MKIMDEIPDYEDDSISEEDGMYHKLKVRATDHIVEETTLEELNDNERILLSLVEKIIKRDYEKSMKNIIIQRNTNRISESSENIKDNHRVNNSVNLSNTIDYDSEAEFTASDSVPSLDDSYLSQTLSLSERIETKQITDSVSLNDCKPYHERAIQSLFDRNNNSKTSKKPKKTTQCGDYYSEKTSTYTSRRYGTFSCTDPFSSNKSNNNFTLQSSLNNSQPASTPVSSSTTSSATTSTTDPNKSKYFTPSTSSDENDAEELVQNTEKLNSVKKSENKIPMVPRKKNNLPIPKSKLTPESQTTDLKSKLTPTQTTDNRSKLTPESQTTDNRSKLMSESQITDTKSKPEESAYTSSNSEINDNSSSDTESETTDSDSSTTKSKKKSPKQNDRKADVSTDVGDGGSYVGGDYGKDVGSITRSFQGDPYESEGIVISSDVNPDDSHKTKKRSPKNIEVTNIPSQANVPKRTVRSFFQTRKYTEVAKENYDRIYRFHLPLSFYYGVEDQF